MTNSDLLVNLDGILWLVLFFLVLYRINFWDGKFSELHEELATIEYYGGLHGREKMVAACDEACRVAVQIMRKYMEEQK